jgi:hypothetical protein
MAGAPGKMAAGKESRAAQSGAYAFFQITQKANWRQDKTVSQND